MEHEDALEERLARLRHSTEPVRARGDLAARVMARIGAEISWHEALLASAWRLLPVAFVAAFVTCALAYRSDQEATSVMVWAEEPAGVVWE